MIRQFANTVRKKSAGELNSEGVIVVDVALFCVRFCVSLGQATLWAIRGEEGN